MDCSWTALTPAVPRTASSEGPGLWPASQLLPSDQSPPDGPIQVTLKRGTQSGEVLRIPGHGMPMLRSSRKGELLVQLALETPRQLTKRQEELFRELAELERANESPQRKTFLEKLRDFFTAEGESSRKA